MVGKNQLTISGTQFAAGLCTSDYLGDGGMGTETFGINPVYKQGAIYSLGTISSSGLSQNLVATSEDYENPTAANRFIVDTSSNISYISNNEIITFATSGSGTGYSLGVTDIVPFTDGTNPKAYVSFATGIGQVGGSVSGGFSYTETWWTGTKSKTALTSGVPHPMLVFQKTMWIGNGIHLANMDSSGNANNDASWVLDPNEEIMALGIDPGTGLMLVSVRSVSSGTNGNIPAKNYVYFYDGYSAQSRRKVPVQGTVFSFTTVAGQVIVGIDNSIGIWNGNGVTFLRRLSSTSSIPYKHRCAAINNHFMVADGGSILGYGDIQNGKKAWFPIYKNVANGNSIDVVFQQNMGTVGTSYDGSAVKFFNLFDEGNGGGAGVFYTNNINFERPVNIHRVRVFTDGITSSGGGSTGIGNVALIDQKSVTYQAAQPKFKVASGTQYVFDFDFGGLQLQTLQPVITFDTQQAFGLIRMVIYYDPAE